MAQALASPAEGGRAARLTTWLAILLVSIFFLIWPALTARAAMNIQEVKSEKGITAWLVED
ncbi:MAG: insulinase family protein, partial [Mesorhizobium sp.]